jgi:hypothetical protein
MKRTGILITFFIMAAIAAHAQIKTTDSIVGGIITVDKDPRLDILAKKEADFNAAAALGPRAEKGYRLLVLSSNDNNYAMKVRSQLLQKYPDQKIYMTFQAPYIKLKLGNFTDKTEAEKFRDRIMKERVVNANVYLVAEIVEVKGDKNKEKEEEQ